MKINLKKFCLVTAYKKMHEAMGQPWTRDGFTYATDGHIVIRVPKIKGVPGNRQAPKAEKAKVIPWNLRVTDRQWKPVNIEPRIDVLGGHWTTKRVKVGRHIIALEYLDLIRRLPNAEIAPGAATKFRPIPFRFEGGQGFVMGMCEEKTKGD